jgi:hypothetical protein
MIVFNNDTVALVIRKQGKKWDMVCVTEYTKNGDWISGMNMITSIDDVLDTAEKKKLNIVFESMLERKT